MPDYQTMEIEITVKVGETKFGIKGSIEDYENLLTTCKNSVEISLGIGHASPEGDSGMPEYIRQTRLKEMNIPDLKE